MKVRRLVRRNIPVERGRASMRSPECQSALNIDRNSGVLVEICEREAQDVSALVRQIEADGHNRDRTSAGGWIRTKLV
jgi:hypothetical protein